MSNDNIVDIHGKKYMTVAGRLQLAHTDNDTLSITTEVIPNGGSVVVKATVVTKKGTFTGISAANPSKAIEKMSPYEVAETSAVGRALGFAGYGAVDSIASADEMVKATAQDSQNGDDVHEENLDWLNGQENAEGQRVSNVSPSDLATPKQVQYIHVLLKQKNMSTDEIYKFNNVTSTKDLTKSQAKAVIDQLLNQ